MITSPEIKELASALASAQADFSAVPKGTVNPFFKSKYAALPDVVAHAAPVLAKHGLAVTQQISFTIVEGKVFDTLTTTLIHQSGQYIENAMLLHLPKQDPQGQGSAVTYARRYAYMAILGLVADDDDDGNAASHPKVQTDRGNAHVPFQKKAADVSDLTKQLREKLAAKYGEPIKGKEAVEGILGKPINKLSELTDAEIAGVLLSLGE
jgi:uncharacterized protein YqgV (UPF0045/DUF77 family)